MRQATYGTTAPATVSSPVIQGMRRADAAVPYRTAAYTRSVNMRTVARLPGMIRSTQTAAVPTSSAVRGRVRRSSSQPAVTASGNRTAHLWSGSAIGPSSVRL